jgi:hypothetical protein
LKFKGTNQLGCGRFWSRRGFRLQGSARTVLASALYEGSHGTTLCC